MKSNMKNLSKRLFFLLIGVSLEKYQEAMGKNPYQEINKEPYFSYTNRFSSLSKKTNQLEINKEAFLPEILYTFNGNIKGENQKVKITFIENKNDINVLQTFYIDLNLLAQNLININQNQEEKGNSKQQKEINKILIEDFVKNLKAAEKETYSGKPYAEKNEILKKHIEKIIKSYTSLFFGRILQNNSYYDLIRSTLIENLENLLINENILKNIWKDFLRTIVLTNCSLPKTSLIIQEDYYENFLKNEKLNWYLSSSRECRKKIDSKDTIKKLENELLKKSLFLNMNENLKTEIFKMIKTAIEETINLTEDCHRLYNNLRQIRAISEKIDFNYLPNSINCNIARVYYSGLLEKPEDSFDLQDLIGTIFFTKNQIYNFNTYIFIESTTNLSIELTPSKIKNIFNLMKSITNASSNPKKDKNMFISQIFFPEIKDQKSSISYMFLLYVILGNITIEEDGITKTTTVKIDFPKNIIQYNTESLDIFLQKFPPLLFPEEDINLTIKFIHQDLNGKFTEKIFCKLEKPKEKKGKKNEKENPLPNLKDCFFPTTVVCGQSDLTNLKSIWESLDHLNNEGRCMRINLKPLTDSLLFNFLDLKVIYVSFSLVKFEKIKFFLEQMEYFLYTENISNNNTVRLVTFDFDFSKTSKADILKEEVNSKLVSNIMKVFEEILKKKSKEKNNGKFNINVNFFCEKDTVEVISQHFSQNIDIRRILSNMTVNGASDYELFLSFSQENFFLKERSSIKKTEISGYNKITIQIETFKE